MNIIEQIKEIHRQQVLPDGLLDIDKLLALAESHERLLAAAQVVVVPRRYGTRESTLPDSAVYDLLEVVEEAEKL
jgi:hypothetical protein